MRQKLKFNSTQVRFVGKSQSEFKANSFIEMLEYKNLSIHTVRAYGFDLWIFLRWLDDKKPIDLVETSDLLDFIKYLKERKASATSINRRLTVMNSFFQFSFGKTLDMDYRLKKSSGQIFSSKDHHLGLHKLDLTGRRKLRLKQEYKVVEPLTRQQVHKFLKQLARYRDLAIVQLMLLCGLRSQEVLSIAIHDISLEEKSILVNGKGKKQRTLPLPDIISDSVEKYLEFERPKSAKCSNLFLILQGHRRSYAMTPAGLRSLFRYRRMHADISNANPHRFRHTFGADMARAGVRLAVLQKMMGHANGLMTLKYINLSMTDISKEFLEASERIKKWYFNDRNKEKT